MITSMNRSELYRTLIGHDNPFKTSNNNKSVEKADTSKITSIPENVRNAMNGNMKDKPIYKDLSNEPNIDRFVLSDELVKQDHDIVAAFRNVELKEMPYECTDAMDFMDPHLQGVLGEGYTNGLPTKERIAEFYGDMAKRLDKAYAEGKFTKEEFDELNELITNQVENDAGAYERLKASYALGEKRGRMSAEQVAEIVKREKGMTPEERLAAREKEIRDYAEKYCKIDRVSLMQLFSLIRYGK